MYLPAGVAVVVEMEIVEEKVGFEEAGLNVYDAPVGSPDRLNETGCVPPLTRVIVVLYDVGSPAVTLCTPGDTERLKSKGGGAGLTVNESTAWLLYRFGSLYWYVGSAITVSEWYPSLAIHGADVLLIVRSAPVGPGYGTTTSSGAASSTALSLTFCG